MKRLLLIIWQCTYGILQSLIGLAVFALNYNREHYFYKNALVTIWKRSDGVSLGLFIFIPETSDENLRHYIERHEYGHFMQSALLGPLYLPIIGIPSFIWNRIYEYRNKKGIINKRSYYSVYTEKWANKLGHNENQ